MPYPSVTYSFSQQHDFAVVCKGSNATSNTSIFTILNELKLDILTTIFRTEDLESPPRLVFNQGLKDFEEVKNFRLMLKEVNPTIPGKFIYEG